MRVRAPLRAGCRSIFSGSAGEAVGLQTRRSCWPNYMLMLEFGRYASSIKRFLDFQPQKRNLLPFTLLAICDGSSESLIFLEVHLNTACPRVHSFDKACLQETHSICGVVQLKSYRKPIAAASKPPSPSALIVSPSRDSKKT